MGRQPYMNLLALGRSPYEAPEAPPQGYVAPERSAVDSVDADGYVQEYNDRGHPVNPSSKALGKQLRRAKNDILSTMGIVVSGEDGNLGISKERQRLNLLSRENDCGLALATLDQIVMFVSSWWTTSLISRIQTFRRYTHVPFTDIIRIERNEVGVFGFYCAGIPAWTVSFMVSVCRNHFLEPALDSIRSKVSALFENDTDKNLIRHVFAGLRFGCKSVLFVILGQTYMFSLLQSLHIVPALAVPAIRSLIPFGQTSLIQMPTIPTTLSAAAIGHFGLEILTSPFTAVYMYVYLRPVVESRIYRILRRQLPKPDRPDNLSIRVAVENDLIEWTVPTLGRRSDEEIDRSYLTIGEELKYELRVFRDWFMGILGLKTAKTSGSEVRRARYESLHSRLEQLHRDLGIVMPPMEEPSAPLDEEMIANSMQARGEQLLSGHVEGARPPTPAPDSSEQEELPMNQILTGDEQRMAQSPLQIPEDYFDERAAGRPGMEEPYRLDSSELPQRPQNRALEENYHSRSNTLFSRPSSPDSSPLTSPRVRASLVHQNSDVITMQLELLRSNHNSPTQTRAAHDAVPTGAPLSNGAPQQTEAPDPNTLERTASELLDAILSNTVPNQTADTTNIPSPESDLVQQLAETNPNPDSFLEALAEGFIAAPAPDAATTTTTTTATTTQQPPTTTAPDHESPFTSQQVLAPTTSNETRDLASLPNTTATTVPGPLTTAPTSRHPHRIRPNQDRNPLLPDHRVTILSSLPVDSLSSHLASLITSILFYPLESLYLRNFTLKFLSSPYILSTAVPVGAATATTLGLGLGLGRADVRGLGAWFGGGSVRDMVAYMGKMVLVVGVEGLVSAAVWGVGTAATVMFGVMEFGWGEL
ncbi:hypothetical protein FQN50_001466 [Emmonsiellopsis sp. PD_5]|nr:hypothetical protein FQN50_001466 [Emmonsiellopsis sp. PD_5]